jgi:hypothetical protein
MAAAVEKELIQRGEQLKRDGIVIRTYNLWKSYVMGDQEIHAVSGVDIEIKRRVRRDHGSFRVGQVDFNEPDWLSRYADQRAILHQRESGQRDERR